MRLATTAALVLLLAGCGSESAPRARPAASDVVTLTDENFEELVLRSGRPVLVDFWAGWCRPCLDMKPELRKAASRLRGRAIVAELDVEANAFTAEKYGVEMLPTLLLFQEGEAVRRLAGPRTHDELVREIERLLAATKEAPRPSPE